MLQTKAKKTKSQKIFEKAKFTTMTAHNLTIDTNFNNKMDCPHLIHIDLAPAKMIHESTLEKTVYNLKTIDDSHPPVAVKLKDIARMSLKNIPSAITWVSHGMDSYTFQIWYLNSKKNVSVESELAVYFFERI
jgi:hypothetical protein